jgi:adenylate kinase family enzyme
MAYQIIIRGPAGVGKSTIAKKLAETLGAFYLSYDDIMRANELDNIEEDGIHTENFIKANNLLLPTIKSKKISILDGCFYRKEQISHLKSKLDKVYIFTLVASLEECIKRNKKRKNPMSKKAITEVYDLVRKVDVGKNINTSDKKTDQIIMEILSDIKKFTKDF